MLSGPSLIRPISLIILGLCFVYISLRAAFVPLFSDEVSTFFRYVQTGGFQPFLGAPNANNHVLNSLFSHLSFLLFGDSPFALRLPNVLSFLLFAYYLIRFQRFFFSPYLAISWILVMTGSHYFISFFHLARGYGMSMAFLFAAIYHLTCFIDKGRAVHLLAICLFSNMAAWANLSLLVPLLAVFGISGIHMIRHFRNRINRKNIIIATAIVFISGILPFYYAILMALDLKEGGALYHGTGEGFIQVVVNRFMSELIPENWDAAPYFFWPLFVIYLLGLIWIFWKKKSDPVFLSIQLVFWLTIIGTISMNIILDVLYPLDRAALHFFPLFVLALFLVLAKIPVSLAIPAATIPASLFMIQQVSFFNFNRTSHWDNEHVPMAVIDELRNWKDSTGIIPLISTHGLPGRVFVYNEYRDGARLNSPVFEGFPAPSADFILTYQWQQHYPEGFVSRKEYPEVKMKLLERKSHDDWLPLIPRQEITASDEESKSGHLLAEFSMDGSKYQAVSLLIQGQMQSNDYPYKGWLALRVSDTSDRELSFHYIDIARVKPDLRKETSIERRIFQDHLPKQKLKIQLRLMNVAGNPYTLKNACIDVMALPR